MTRKGHHGNNYCQRPGEAHYQCYDLADQEVLVSNFERLEHKVRFFLA